MTRASLHRSALPIERRKRRTDPKHLAQQALRAAYDGGSSRIARASRTAPGQPPSVERMESKGEGKYDDDDVTRRAAAP